MEWLLRRMEQWRDDPAIIWREEEFTFGDILDRVAFWSEKLSKEGLPPGSVIALEGDYSLNACALLLALTRLRAIIVPLTTASAPHKEEFLETAEVQALLALDQNDSFRMELCPKDVRNPLILQLRQTSEPGLVLFSSGSTGKSKAVLHNFTKLLDKFKPSRRRLRTMNFLLFDHIGGVNTLFYTISNGGVVIATQERNPDVVCKLIERHRVELLPTTPTFLNLLLISELYRHYDLSSLKLITYGTEVMPEAVLKRLHRALPQAELLQTYGLSELGILRSKSKSSDSLWLKVGGDGFETKVVDGILWVRADSAMMGYLNAPQPFTDDGWLITGDAVQMDGEYIRILGRRSEIINVGGEKVYPAEVESLLQTMEGVEEVVVTGEANPITGQIVKAQVRVKTGETVAEFRKRMRQFCREKLASYKIPQKVELTAAHMHGARYKKMRRS